MLNRIKVNTYFGRLIILRGNEDILVQEYALPLRGDLLSWSWSKAVGQGTSIRADHKTYTNGKHRDRPAWVKKGQPMMTDRASPKNRVSQLQTPNNGYSDEVTTEKNYTANLTSALAKVDIKNESNTINKLADERKLPRWIPSLINSNDRSVHGAAAQATDVMQVL